MGCGSIEVERRPAEESRARDGLKKKEEEEMGEGRVNFEMDVGKFRPRT